MGIEASKRVQELGTYAFAEVDRKVQELRSKGLDVVDFGVGDPSIPTPSFVLEAEAQALEKFARSGYPSYVGSAEFLQEVASWTQNRFGVKLDPATEICSSIGSKEAIFHFPEAILNEGDVAIVPDPGYPPYARGTRFAEGEVYSIPIGPENDFLPDLSTIPESIAKRAKIFWLTHPNSPTGKVASPEYLEQWIQYCQKHDIIAASDEAYTEIYFGDVPASALEFGRKGVVVFQSLSKRSAMTGHRIGWVAGDPEIISWYKKVKTNIDSGTPRFVQEGAIAALRDEKHVEEMREEYRKKRDLLVDAFEAAGCPRSEPEAALYIWQAAPQGISGMQLFEALLSPKIGAVTVPGIALCDLSEEERGDVPYVRLALVPSVADCQKIAHAIREHLSF